MIDNKGTIEVTPGVLLCTKYLNRFLVVLNELLITNTVVQTNQQNREPFL